MPIPTYFSEQYDGATGICTTCRMPLTIAAWRYHFALYLVLGHCPSAVEMAMAGMAQRGREWGLTDRTITIAPVKEG